MDRTGPLRLHTYGSIGPPVIVLHGGPAAVGTAAPLARGLADTFMVFEPWQRGSGAVPLTVGQHVADLHALVLDRCGAARPAIVGHSWGAMLALAYAAAHPDTAGPIVLVGCGTFDPVARARMKAIFAERTDSAMKGRLEHLVEEYPNPGDQLIQRHELTEKLYTYAPIAKAERDEGPTEPFDIRAHDETWGDMIRLQEAGIYPAGFAAITSPVLMLHGAYDPHPGQMIRASLLPHLPHLEYREWEQCGHYPWREQFVREEFFAVLRDWLAHQLTASPSAH